MKHSQYIMSNPWSDPTKFYWEVVTKTDGKGHVLATKRVPAFIASHRTAPDSVAEGVIICVRKLTMDVKPLPPPH